MNAAERYASEVDRVPDLLTALFEGEDFKGMDAKGLAYRISFPPDHGETFTLRFPPSAAAPGLQSL
ncbi:hypothetical protein CPY51_05655 [Rhizobium tubonense]|uniref:Uncharacterized protein n=1 Tax=Rhizobium tubonense TaxID=484088 RepID=A0A2W4F0H7_9HYPH|nr:hypothetical protein CPY51_05655 [Rhizobium tubonense]